MEQHTSSGSDILRISKTEASGALLCSKNSITARHFWMRVVLQGKLATKPTKDTTALIPQLPVLLQTFVPFVRSSPVNGFFIEKKKLKIENPQEEHSLSFGRLEPTG
jgi:hypothetical protein